MKTLYLIRHGKSSWKDSSLEDKERPLKRRGERDAKMMAKILRKKGIKPQQIFSSPANRAFTTARIFAKQLDYNAKNLTMSDKLYFEGVATMLDAIHQLNDKLDVVFMFGHNPDFTEFVNRFSKEAIDNVPTCGVAGIEFKVDAWKEASFTKGNMIFFDYPSNHK